MGVVLGALWLPSSRSACRRRLVVHLVCAVRDSAGGLVARARRAVRAAAGEDGLDVEEEAAQLLQLAPLRLTPRCHATVEPGGCRRQQ